jgi:photosystem II stability/assembly factor-like uncharacterized protein
VISSPVGLNLRAIGLAGDPDTGRIDVAIIAGDTNLVLRSDDQGNTWTRVSITGTSDQLLSVEFPEPRIGYIGGLQTIRQSTDYGRTWRIVSSTQAKRPRDPRGFSFPSVNRGYAVGQNGQIARTNDGGTTWVALPSGTNANLRSVFFVDEETGYVVGDGGVLLVTNNGGGTWTSVNSGTHLDLWGISFVDRAVGFGVGQGGIVLKSTSGGLATRDVPPAIVATSPAGNEPSFVPTNPIRITFNKDIVLDTAAYGDLGPIALRDETGRLILASVTYNASNRQVVIAPAQPLRPGARYTLTVAGGTGGIVDTEGRQMIFDYTTQFRTGCGEQVGGGFGRLIAAIPTVGERVGCTVGDELVFQGVEQVFERGHLLWVGLPGQPVVLATFFADGSWRRYDDTSGDGESQPVVIPPTGMLAPERGFGKVWREQPAIREGLGWALRDERPFIGAVQLFDSGSFMVWTGTDGGLIRVYYGDGGTLVAADTSQPEPVSQGPQPSAPSPFGAPALLTPSAGASVEQNNSNIGCAAHSARGFGYRITFEWTPVEGARAYEITVSRSGESPLLSTAVRAPVLNYTSCNTFIPESQLNNWQWRVRAIGANGPSAWSATSSFSFTPCRIQGTSCTARD